MNLFSENTSQFSCFYKLNVELVDIGDFKIKLLNESWAWIFWVFNNNNNNNNNNNSNPNSNSDNNKNNNNNNSNK